MEVLMGNRRPYMGKLTALAVRTSLKAVAIVTTSATLVILAMAIGRAGSGNSDSPGAGKFVGVRHDAMSISRTADTPPGVATPAADQTSEPSSDTVVRNGITVVSPRLLVPVIEADFMETASGSDDGTSSGKGLHAGKRSRYAHRAHTRHRHNRWTAYGLALR
jgi:hypothetical protein